LIFAGIIVFLHDETYFQILAISISNLILFSILVIKLPFKDLPENIINSIAEILLIISTGIISSYKEDNEPEDDRIFRGWFIVAIWALVFMVMLVYFFVNVVREI